MRQDAAAIWAVGEMGDVEIGDGRVVGEMGEGSWTMRTVGCMIGSSNRAELFVGASAVEVTFARNTMGMSSGCQISQSDLRA